MQYITELATSLSQKPRSPVLQNSYLWTYDLFGPVCNNVMLLMRANPLRGQVGGSWALEIETFLGPVKWHRAVRRVPFGAQKSRIKSIMYRAVSIRGP
jgi:hypothetical protein